MKKLVFLISIALIFCFEGLSAQSLDFSQILLVNNVEDTVPAGSVWKITSILTDDIYQIEAPNTCANGQFSEKRAIFVNGQKRLVQAESVGTGASGRYFSGNSLPFWLPGGTRLRTSCSGVDLSVIEFTVTP